MGLSPKERDSHQLTLEAYDRLLDRYRKRKVGYMKMRTFLVDITRELLQIGNMQVAGKISRFLDNLED